MKVEQKLGPYKTDGRTFDYGTWEYSGKAIWFDLSDKANFLLKEGNVIVVKNNFGWYMLVPETERDPDTVVFGDEKEKAGGFQIRLNDIQSNLPDDIYIINQETMPFSPNRTFTSVLKKLRLFHCKNNGAFLARGISQTSNVDAFFSIKGDSNSSLTVRKLTQA